ncbi:MAG: TRAM domain-containing protein [Nitrososphaerota archaeon]|jgi:predicted RNA-binding protein with TRAM domain|uniref:TRAM domain-containing protein n=1 Tax=Candidatus Bathycorpusculum sp. TaxID=2994959 RepID=UPI0028172FD8|nr:TRAM domain-containing protein [Candidatus Termiticorpusculum sp.]MCL2258098.1 TRAM domain-containing protein [Candidatus Termiticorpusculum sp.]MCL2291644.1 TRAM domain-containing protein [Candidatus Termiticorpusculum sp.]MDR0461408.1 TRAM domain-containing protein [Nitrososphaerota archaeon]
MVHRRVRGGKFKIKHVDEPCPVEVDQEIAVTIIDLAPNGDGRLNIRGFSILVPKAKPRDSVKVKIVSVNEKYAVGQIIP